MNEVHAKHVHSCLVAGAIAEAFYLPALEKRPDLLSSLIVVDKDAARAEAVRQRLGAAASTTDHREVLTRVNGAIVATPPALHTPLTLEFVGRGVHVLCEKPLSRTAAEVDQVGRGCRSERRPRNQTRRLYALLPGSAAPHCRRGDRRRARDRLRSGRALRVAGADQHEFGAAAGGRGVLFDGVDIVDLVCWFLGGVAEVKLRLGGANARIPGPSRLSKLRNTYRITGTRGPRRGQASSFTHRDPRGKVRRIKTDGPGEGGPVRGQAPRQLRGRARRTRAADRLGPVTCARRFR